MLKLNFLSITFLIINIGLCPKECISQPKLSVDIKAAVYRIVSIEDTIFYEGTGIMFSKNKHYFLITNKHVITDSHGIIRDSIYLYMNAKSSNGDVLSGPGIWKILLNISGKKTYFLPLNSTIDLALIRIMSSNVNFGETDSVYSIKTSAIPDIGRIKAYLNDNTILTVIGYPGKDTILASRTPEYLWGDFLEIEDTYIKSNAPILHGSSGSALIARNSNRYKLVGIIFMRYNVAYAIPASYIFTCFNSYFDQIDEAVE